MNENERRELYRFSKNAGEELVFSMHQYKGRDYFDIRVWRKAILGTGEESMPTKKGVTVSTDCLPTFMEGISQLNEAYYQGVGDESKQ